MIAPSILVLATLGLLFCVLSPYAGAIVSAITIGIAFYPLHLWIKSKLPRDSHTLTALISNVLVVCFLLAPLVLMTWFAVDQSDQWSPVLKEWQAYADEWREGRVPSSPAIRELQGWTSDNFSISPTQLRRQLAKMASATFERGQNLGARGASALIGTLDDFAILTLILFFIFRDGENIYKRFESYLPMDAKHRKEIKERGHDIVIGVVRGWFLCAIIQGSAASIGYAIGGVKQWMLLGFLTMITGLIPYIGTALVWVPVALLRYVNGSPGQATFIIIWGVLVVSFLDNVLRPYFVSRRSEMPFVYMILALLGGLAAWGMKGIILGPVLFAIAPVIFDMGKERFNQK